MLIPLRLSETKDGLVRICVAYTGQFEMGKEFAISESDLAAIARNLNAREVPIDYNHLSAMGNGTPEQSKAAGWLKGPASIERFDDRRKALWAWAEFTPACLKALRDREFRYFSPEIHWADKDERGKPTGTRLAAGAIVNRPFLKDLPPITISAADFQPLMTAAVAMSERRKTFSLSPKGKNMQGNELDRAISAYMAEHLGADYIRSLREVTRRNPELWDEHRRMAAIETTPCPEEQSLHEAVTAYMSERSGCDYATALNAVTRANPELWDRWRTQVYFG